MADEKKTVQEELPESRNFTSTSLSRRTSAPADSLRHDRPPPVFRRSPTAICISATARRCASISAPLRSSADVQPAMDDTNPAKEDTEYVDAIQEDIHWLGF